MKLRTHLAFLALLPSLGLAAAAPISSVSLVRVSDSLKFSQGGIRIVEVRDLRVLATRNSRLLGSTSLGVFGERASLHGNDPVSTSVQTLLRSWIPTDTTAPPLPVRIELQSFDSWILPGTGSNTAKARVSLRVVSLDSARSGFLMAPESNLERKGLNGPEEQAALLREGLRTAFLAFLQSDWKTQNPSTDWEAKPIAPDPWTDPEYTVSTTDRAVRQPVQLMVSAGLAGIGVGARYSQYYEPADGWNPEYWAGFSLRDPLADSKIYRDVWVGELQGGYARQRRMGGGTSDFVMIQSLGGLLGLEYLTEWKTDPQSVQKALKPEKRNHGVYFGAEGRFGMRWEPAGKWGPSAGAGVHAALRAPSLVQMVDLGVNLEAGWRF